MIDGLDHCPHCDSKNLHEITYQDDVRFRGKTLRIEDLRTYSCRDCGEEVMTSKQFEENTTRIARSKAAQVEAERRRLGLLQAKDVRKIRELLGITQRTAACIFGGGINAFSKYERGEGKQSEAMDILLRLARDVPEVRPWLRSRAGLSMEACGELHPDQPPQWQTQSLRLNSTERTGMHTYIVGKVVVQMDSPYESDSITDWSTVRAKTAHACSSERSR